MRINDIAWQEFRHKCPRRCTTPANLADLCAIQGQELLPDGKYSPSKSLFGKCDWQEDCPRLKEKSNEGKND